MSRATANTSPASENGDESRRQAALKARLLIATVQSPEWSGLPRRGQLSAGLKKAILEATARLDGVS